MGDSMEETFLERLLSRKSLFVAFWFSGVVSALVLVGFSAYLVKEVPPIPAEVRSASGEILYTGDDVIAGKALFQQFDLMDYGTMLGMGAYLGPEFAGDFMHRRAEFLYEKFSAEIYGGKKSSELSNPELAYIKGKVKEDFSSVVLTESGATYSDASAEAYKANRDFITDFLVNGNKEKAWRGGIIRPDEAHLIAAFFDWGQLVSSSIRPGTERTWSNNWPSEPLIDQTHGYSSVIWSLAQLLILWTMTIVVLFVLYEYLMEKGEKPENPLAITGLFPSQLKLTKYLPVVALFFLLQVILGGYLAHIYTEPAENFIISQDILPFNITRAIHINLAIVWVAIGWLVGGMFIAPLVAGKDLRIPFLVDILWAALLIVGGGGLIGMYLGAQGQMRDYWFWLGNEGREYLNLGRVWDIGLVIGLVLWFGMVFSTIRKAKENNIMVGTIIWAAFGVATLYMAGMAPLHKIMPNYTVDDYYRWWVVHLWVELTFELFAAGVLAYLSVILGLVPRTVAERVLLLELTLVAASEALVPRTVAERVLLLELTLVAASGVLGVGHHYWWQGLDEYWIAIGSIFSALEPIPLVVLMIEAWKERSKILERGDAFAFNVPFLWLAGSAALNWFGAGFLGMVINLPIVNYYAHGTYLIMPHGHVALLGAFGYISIAFIYIVARSRAMAMGLSWSDSWGKLAFWLVTVGIVLFALPTLIIGLHQTETAFELGYYAARTRETIEQVKFWMWIRIIPDGLVVLGALVLFADIVKQTVLNRKPV